MSTRILLIDLSERELKERQRLIARKDQLEALMGPDANADKGARRLTDAQKQELEDIVDSLDRDEPVDPFFRAVAAHVLNKPSWEKVRQDYRSQGERFLMEHGMPKSQLKGDQEGEEPDEQLTRTEQEMAAVCGILQLDNQTIPTVAHFVRRMTEAQGLYRECQPLFEAAFRKFAHRFEVKLRSQFDSGLADKDIVGCIQPGGQISKRKNADNPLPAGGDQINALSAKQVAAVVKRLASEGITANDPWLDSRLDSAFDLLSGASAGRPASTLEINLPNLEEAADVDIIKENLYAVQAIYFSYTLEEMRLFQVMEQVVNLFRQGLLPLGRGKVGDYLFGYYKRAAERFTEPERRDLYMRVFGAPGGNPVGGEPNRDFNELWLRFVAAVSSFARQLTVERMLRGTVPLAVSQEQVRKAGRDLAANLSRNGFGIAYFAATELQQAILEFRDILQDAELRSAFGARDMWQVIDTVNVNYLGGARNTYRYRTQSRAGAVIIRWLANSAARLASVGGSVIEIAQILNPVVRAANTSSNPTVDPSDWDLVNACEQWLAVGGVSESSVEQYSQSIESPVITSKPIEMPQMQIPQIAQQVLDGVGLSIPAM
jgi:hypothetical protein